MGFLKDICTLLLSTLPVFSLVGCAGLPQDAGNKVEHRQDQAQTLIERVNRLRRDNGLQPLALNKKLCRIARQYSVQQAKRGEISHTDIQGKRLEYRLRHAGYTNWIVAGENLATNNADDPVSQAVRGWQLSSSHRDNLYSPEYNRTGAAIVTVNEGQGVRNYITQIYVQQ